MSPFLLCLAKRAMCRYVHMRRNVPLTLGLLAFKVNMHKETDMRVGALAAGLPVPVGGLFVLRHYLPPHVSPPPGKLELWRRPVARWLAFSTG